MSDTSEKLFTHGARWVRADFHLHTIKEKDSSRKKLRDEWKNDDGTFREDEFMNAFVTRLKEEEIRVACITNHDSLNYGEFKAIAKKAKKNGILVLPGLELSVQGGSNGVHTLVIFDPGELTSDDQRIRDFLAGQFPGGNIENRVTSDDFCKCFEKLEKLDLNYFIVFAHVETENGLFGALKGPNLQEIYKGCKPIWDQRVLALQKIRSEDHVLAQKLGAIAPLAHVEGSDPRDSIAEVGNQKNGVSYLKLSDLTFTSVKFALKDHKLRVAPTLPVETKRPRIVSLEIQTQQKGIFGHFFSADLNTLIGSRGAGKSLIVEAIRWGLGKESGSGDDDYKKGLLDAFLQKGGKVTLQGIDKNGDEVTITRHYLGKRNPSSPEILVKGQPANISIESLFPGLLYFGQKDLGIRSDQSDTQLFDQLLGPLPEELSQNVNSKKQLLVKAAETCQATRRAKETDDEYAYELKALTTKLAEFREKGVEDKLQAITVFDNDLRLFQTFLKDFKRERKATSEQLDALLEIAKRFPELKSAENSAAADLLGTAETVFHKAIPDLEETIPSFLDEIGKGLALVKTVLEQNQFTLQSKFAEILREIDEPDLDLDSYRKMVSRHKQLVELRELTKSEMGELPAAKRELISAGDLWLAALQAAADHQNHQLIEINKQLPEKLNLEIEAFGDKAAFEQFIEAMMKGTGFTAQAREAIVSSTASGFEIFKRWEALTESELTPAMAAKLTDALDENFAGFLTFASPDSKHITYDGKRINELSLGKRAMALLVLLLSLEDYPIIIIDQPEDDLDNETIHRMIVEPLRMHKGKTQFIIATHNPNIPVLADAEQVIACYETVRGEYQHQAGSLDKPLTKNAIIKIMEGGERAFERRHEIYSQWTK